MAQTITAPQWGNTVQGPNQKTSETGLTGAGAVFTPDNPAFFVIARINVKTYTKGTGTTGPVFSVLASDDVAQATNPVTLNGPVFPQAASIGMLQGVCATGAKKSFSIAVTLSGTDTIVYDYDMVCT